MRILILLVTLSFTNLSFAGSCKIEANYVGRPGVFLKYEYLGGSIDRNSTFEACLENTQHALYKVRNELSKKELLNIGATGVYTEADEYDRNAPNTSVTISASISKKNGKFPSKEQSNCEGFAHDPTSVLRATFQKAGTEGKTFFNIKLNSDSRLTKVEQCAFAGANLYLKKFTGTKSDSFEVTLSNMPLQGTNTFYKLLVSAGRPDADLKRIFLPSLERLKE